MRICLIRHGETDWNAARRLQGREDIPLNENGLRQSKQLAAYLKQFDWHTIISSPLTRAKQTAAIIADTLGLPTVFEDAGFMERDYGKASGMPPEQRKATYPDGRYEGMEEWDVLQKRVYDALLQWVSRCGGSHVIIVSHGGAINSILATLSNHEIGTGKTRLQPACISLLEEKDGKLEIVFYNQEAAC